MNVSKVFILPLCVYALKLADRWEVRQSVQAPYLGQGPVQTNRSREGRNWFLFPSVICETLLITGIKRTAVELTEDEKATLQNKNFEIDFEEHIGQVKVRNFFSSFTSYLEVVSAQTIHSRRGGFYCEVCDCVMKDSTVYTDHINGKKRIFLIASLLSSDVPRSKDAWIISACEKVISIWCPCEAEVYLIFTCCS